MKRLDNSTLSDFTQRLAQLEKNTEPKWGTMNAAQMLEHLNRALLSAQGELPVKNLGNIFFKTVGKWGILYSPMSFPKSSPTAKEFKVTEAVEFEKAKSDFLAIIQRFHQQKPDFKWAPHPLFGKMKANDWKRLTYLHVNYHFGQFGI